MRELERIYGIKQGGDRRSENFNSTNGGIEKTQKDLQNETGLDKESYRRYKKLAELPEDIQQMVLDGVVTPSVASRVIAKLPSEEQSKLAEQLIGKDKVSGSEVQKYIDGSGRSSDEFRRHNLHRAYGRSSGRPKIGQPDYSTCGSL